MTGTCDASEVVYGTHFWTDNVREGESPFTVIESARNIRTIRRFCDAQCMVDYYDEMMQRVRRESEAEFRAIARDNREGA